MLNFSLFQRDFSLPRPSCKQWGALALCLILPNILFWLLTWFTIGQRTIFNVDYLLAMICFLLPFRITKILGVIIFWLAVFFDAIMFTIYFFPFIDLSSLRYLLPFFSIAPKIYQIAIFVFLAYALILPIFMKKIAKWQNPWLATAAIAIFMMFSVVDKDLGLSWVSSQFGFYKKVSKSNFAIFSQKMPTLSPYPANKETASRRLLQPNSDKILYIVAESWGSARKDSMQKDILKNIYQQENLLEFIHAGYFDFSGATVQGEIRELCQLRIDTGFALNLLEKNQFSTCLPNVLKAQNYQTFALHNTNGQLYERVDWYPKAGFQHIQFGDGMSGLTRCTAFNGICDWEMPNQIMKTFSAHTNQKIFYYWLTLSAHNTYYAEDIKTTRFQCEQYGLNPAGEMCRNSKLNVQLMDSVATLIARPEMKGVEVIIVGDHMPPILDGEDTRQHLRWNEVSWLHFKIK